MWFVEHAVQLEAGLCRETEDLRRDVIGRTACARKHTGVALRSQRSCVVSCEILTCGLHHTGPELRLFVQRIGRRSRQLVHVNTRRGADVTVVTDEHVKVLNSDRKKQTDFRSHQCQKKSSPGHVSYSCFSGILFLLHHPLH